MVDDDSDRCPDSESGPDSSGSPDPPARLPNYIAEGLPKQDIETLTAARKYIDELIARFERPVEERELPETADPIEESADGYVVEELVKCGKENCRCTSGREEDLHGPYEYRYYRDDSGTLRKEYADNE
jgi:hypothetical protein